MDSQSESDDEELQFDRIKEGKPKKQHKYCFKCSVDQTIFTLGVLSETVYCGVLIDAKTSDSQISQLLFFPGLRGGRIDYDKKTLPIEVQISDRDLKGFAEFRFCYAVSAQSDKKIDIIDNKKIVCSKWYETIPVVDTKAIKTFGSTEEVASFIKHMLPDDESAFITSSEKSDLSSTETDKGPEKVSSTGPLAHVVESKLEEIEDQISSTQLHQSSAIGDETPSNPQFVNETNRANTLKDECFEENTETANDDKSTTSELRDSGENALDKQDKKECPELYGPSPKQSMILKSLESQVSHNFNEETENRQSNNAHSVLVETSCKFEEHEKLKEEGECFRNRTFSPSESEKTEYGQSVSSVIKNKKEDKTSVSQSTHIVQAVIDKDILQLGKDSLIISLTTTVGSHTSQGVVVAATDDWAILSFDIKLQVEKFEDVPYFYRVHAPRDSHSEIHREILPNRVNFRVMNDKDFTAEENNVKIKYDGVICWYKSEKDTNYTFASQKKNEGTNWVFTDSQFYEIRNLTGFKIYCRNFASQLKQDFNLNRFEIDAGKTWKSLSSVRFEGNNQIIIMRNTSVYLETLQVLIDLALEPNASSLDSGLAIVFIVNFMHLLNTRGTLSKIKQETTSSVMNLLRNTGEGLESRLTNRVSKRYPTDVQPNAKSFISYALHVSRKCKSGHTVKWSDDLLEDDATNFSGPQIYQNLPEIQPRDRAQSNSLIEVSGALTTLVASKQPVSRPAIEAQDQKDYAEEKSSLKHGSLSQSFSTRAHLPHETTPKPKENVEDPDHHQVDPSSLKHGSFSQSYSTGAHLPHEIIPKLKEKVEDPDQHQVDPSSSKHGSLSQSSSAGAHLPHETIPKLKEKVEDPDQHQVDPSSSKHGSLSQSSSTGTHLPHETTPEPKEKVEDPDQHQVDPSSSKHGSLSQSSSTGAHLLHEKIPKPKEKVEDPDQHQVDPSSSKHGSLSQSSSTGAHLPHETFPKPKEKVEDPDQHQVDPSSSKHGFLSQSSSTGAHLPHETTPKSKEKVEGPDQHQVDPSSSKHGYLSQSFSTGAHLLHEKIPKPKEKVEDPDQHQVDPSSSKHGSLSQSSSTGAHLLHEKIPKPKEKVEDPDQHQVDPSSSKHGSLSQSSSTGAHLPHETIPKPKEKVEDPDQHPFDPSSSKHGFLSQSSSTGAHLPHETTPKSKENVEGPDQHQVDPSSSKHGSLSQSSSTGAHLPYETIPKLKEKDEDPDQHQVDPSSSKHGSLSQSSSTGTHLPHETTPKPKEKVEDPDQHQVDPSSTKHGSLSQSSLTGAHLPHETIPKPKEKAEDPDQHQVDPSSTKHGSLSQSSSTGAHLKHELTPKPKEKIEDHDQHQVDPSSLKLGSLSQSSSTGAHLPHNIFSKLKTKIEVHCNQGFSSPKLEFFDSTSQKNKNSNHTSVQEAISNEGYEPSGQIRNRWRILTAVDSKITQIEGELVVFLMLEKEIIYDGKILFVTDSWAILLFEIEPIETNKNHVCFIFGVRSTAPDQVRHFREVLPGDHRYIQTANLQKGLENYTGMIVWKKSENFLEKGWNFVGKYLKGNGDYFNQHSKAFEVYCVYFASKFADELNLVTFLRDVSSVWNSLARVYHKKQEDVIVFKEQFSQYQLLDTMVDVARNKQGSNRDLAVVALLQLTNSVFNSADKTFKYVKEHSLAEIFRLAGFENKEKRDESAKKANSREYEDQFRNSNQACFLLIMHRGNDTHVLNVIEWISLTNNLLQSQTSFEVQTLPLVANEFFSSDESKIAMLAQSKNWVSVRNLHKLCLRMDQYIHSLRIALSRDAIDTKLIEKFDLLREMLNDGEFSLRYEQEKLIFDKCIGEIDMFLGGKADFTSIAHQNFILLALDLAEVAEASQQGVCESQRKWFDAIVTYSRNILEASLKPDLAKSAAKFWIEICTNKLKLPNQTSYFRGELAEKVTNYLFSNSQAMLTMAETDNLKLKSSLLGPVFENAELNQLVREFQLTDPQALFNINHSNHRHACGKIFEELLKMFPNIQVLNTYEILHKSAQWKLLLLLITSCPKLNPTEQCKVLMNLIVRAYCTASNEIHKQSISFENLKKIQQKTYVFVSVCHLLHQRDWLHGKSLNAQQI